MKKVRSKLRPTEIGVIKTFSLSPDDEVGEIAVQCSGCTYYYNNLSELCEKWEDYEEQKVFWYIEDDGDIHHIRTELCDELEIHTMKQIGNYFETKEEAEKAVEKLKAWKRLEEARFAFGLPEYTLNEDSSIIGATGSVGFSCLCYEDFDKDLDFLFGGEK